MDSLKLRKSIKDKKPDFIRQDAHKKKRVGDKWKKPKGLQSKMRLNRKGYRRSPSQGYRSPRDARGLHSTGLVEKLVSTIEQLKDIDAKKEGIIISSKLGNRKRVAIIEKAEDLKITILNIKNPTEFVKQIKDKLSKKKTQKEERKKTKEKKKKELEKKSEKEEKKDELDEEEKKKQEKKEKDKLLTQKQ